MECKTRIWMSLGTAILVGGSAAGQATAALPPATASGVTSGAAAIGAAAADGRVRLAQAEEAPFEGGEGGEGEGGEGGGPVLGTITEFRLTSTDPNAFAYDASPQVAAYATLVHASYLAAHAAAVRLQDAVSALLADPSAAVLEAARAAWIDARAAYVPTEAFMFYAGPVDGPEGPAPRLGAWPIDPGFIDYVEGDPDSGLVNDPAQPLSRFAIVGLNQADDPTHVTAGWHVIEFLLWGEDLSAEGPGARPASDYAPGIGNNDRRRTYLQTVTQLLVLDLSTLVAQWAPGANNYAAAVLAMDQRNAIGRAFNGMAVLAGYEVGLRRLGGGLFRGGAEFEQSRFSDNTAQDIVNALAGARNVYLGSSDGTASGAGFDALLGEIAPEINDRVLAAFAAAEAAVAAIDSPFDAVLASPPGSSARADADAAIDALTQLADALRTAGNRLGVLVVVPGV
jgi:putative iron-regulated protein